MLKTLAGVFFPSEPDPGRRELQQAHVGVNRTAPQRATRHSATDDARPSAPVAKQVHNKAALHSEHAWAKGATCKSLNDAMRVPAQEQSVRCLRRVSVPPTMSERCGKSSRLKTSDTVKRRHVGWTRLRMEHLHLNSRISPNHDSSPPSCIFEFLSSIKDLQSHVRPSRHDSPGQRFPGSERRCKKISSGGFASPLIWVQPLDIFNVESTLPPKSCG